MNIQTPRKLIVILGGTGFVGHHLCASLTAAGHRVRVLSRHPERTKDLLVLPTLTLEKVDVFNQMELNHGCRNADVVINLIGILNESGHSGSGFYKAHVVVAQKVITACQHNAVPRLLHMSALNADSVKGRSFYLRTKGDAESYVHRYESKDFHVTSFRPSVIFGEGDSFLNRFAELLKHSPGIFFLPTPNALFAPIYVKDVVNAMMASLDNHQTFNQHYDLCGSRVYTLQALVSYIATVNHIKRKIIGLPSWASRWVANIMEYVPGKPFSKDNYLSTLSPSVCKNSIPAILGVTLTPLENKRICQGEDLFSWGRSTRSITASPHSRT